MSELRKRDLAGATSTSNSPIDPTHSNEVKITDKLPGVNGKQLSPSIFGGLLKALANAYNIRSHVTSLFSRQDNTSARTDNLSSLDGYRALLCLWMICYHSMVYLLEFSPDKSFAELSTHPSLLFIMFGFLPVDGFFVLTGFLLALPIFQEEKKICDAFDTKDKNKESNGDQGNKNGNEANGQNLHVRSWFSVENFHYRRIVRFLPSYILAFTMYCKVIFPGGIQSPMSMVRNDRLKQFFLEIFGPVENRPNSCGGTPITAAMLFLNNVLPWGGCMGYTWSLAVQFVFYMFFPIMIYSCLRVKKSSSDSVYTLNHSRYLRVLFFVIFGNLFLRFYVFLHLRRFTEENLGAVKAFTGFSFYSNAFLRISTIFVGTFIAYISVYYKSHIIRWRQDFSAVKRELLCSCVWMIIVAFILLQMFYNSIFEVPVDLSAPGAVSVALSQKVVPYTTRWDGINSDLKHLVHWVYWAMFIAGSPFCAFFFGLIIFMIVHRIGFVATRISNFLSLSIWSPLSTLSFQAYLYHPMLLVRTYVNLMSVWGNIPLTLFSFAGLCLWNICSTFTLSFFIWLFVEQPMDILLRPPRVFEIENNSSMSAYTLCRRLIRVFAIVVTTLVPIVNTLAFLFVLFAWEPENLTRTAFQQLTKK